MPSSRKIPPVFSPAGKAGGFRFDLRLLRGGRKSAAGPVLGFRLAVLLGAMILSAAGAGAAAASVAAKDDRGVLIRLDAPPRRIVALAPNLTEIVFLLGKGDRLVGVTRYCNFPPEAAALPRIGGIGDPDVERIAAADPDLVLCTTDGNPRDRVLALEEIGIPCFCLAPQDMTSMFAAIERVGGLLGVPSRARRETEALRTRAARAGNTGGATARDGEPPRVLFFLSTSPLIAAGTGTFLDEIIRDAGGRNAAAGFSGRYPRLSVESLLTAAPDVVFVAAMVGVERLPPEVTRWKEVPAFRDGAVVYMDGDLVTRPGPRMVAALEAVSGALREWRTRRSPPRDSARGRVEAGRAGTPARQKRAPR